MLYVILVAKLVIKLILVICQEWTLVGTKFKWVTKSLLTNNEEPKKWVLESFGWAFFIVVIQEAIVEWTRNEELIPSRATSMTCLNIRNEIGYLVTLRLRLALP